MDDERVREVGHALAKLMLRKCADHCIDEETLLSRIAFFAMDDGNPRMMELRELRVWSVTHAVLSLSRIDEK